MIIITFSRLFTIITPTDGLLTPAPGPLHSAYRIIPRWTMQQFRWLQYRCFYICALFRGILSSPITFTYKQQIILTLFGKRIPRNKQEILYFKNKVGKLNRKKVSFGRKFLFRKKVSFGRFFNPGQGDCFPKKGK